MLAKPDEWEACMLRVVLTLLSLTNSEVIQTERLSQNKNVVTAK